MDVFSPRSGLAVHTGGIQRKASYIASDLTDLGKGLFGPLPHDEVHKHQNKDEQIEAQLLPQSCESRLPPPLHAHRQTLITGPLAVTETNTPPPTAETHTNTMGGRGVYVYIHIPVVHLVFLLCTFYLLIMNQVFTKTLLLLHLLVNILI